MLRALKLFWHNLRRRPGIDVHIGGRCTPRPRIAVGLHSKNGIMTLRAWEDTPAHRAEAKLYYDTIRRVTGYVGWVDDDVQRTWDACPHDYLDWDRCPVCNH